MDKVDWSRPIEAVHRDTDAVASKVALTGHSMNGVREVAIGSRRIWVSADGLSPDWQVRNVATPAPKYPKYPEALVERAIAVVREGAQSGPGGNGPLRGWSAVAADCRAIVTELPAEVDAVEVTPEDDAAALAYLAEPVQDNCQLAYAMAKHRSNAVRRALADADAGRAG